MGAQMCPCGDVGARACVGVCAFVCSCVRACVYTRVCVCAHVMHFITDRAT